MAEGVLLVSSDEMHADSWAIDAVVNALVRSHRKTRLRRGVIAELARGASMADSECTWCGNRVLIVVYFAGNPRQYRLCSDCYAWAALPPPRPPHPMFDGLGRVVSRDIPD